MRRIALIPLVLAAALALCLPARAQEFPSKLVRIVVPFPPGGGADRLGRMLAEKLRVKWGQPVIVENRAGAAGNVGAEHVWSSPPDGYTLLYGTAGQIVISKLAYRKLNYDADTFVPVSLLTRAPLVLVVHPEVKADSLRQLIALAKAEPGRLNYSSVGTATAPHLAAELFHSMAGAKSTHVPFNGTAPALNALLGGQVHMMFTEVNNAYQYIRAGRVRALAVGSEKRLAVLPELPAFSEVLPGLVASAWGGVAAPPGTPPAVVNTLSQALAEAMKQPDVAKYLNESYIEAVGSTPAEMAFLIRQEKARWGDVIRSINLSMD